MRLARMGASFPTRLSFMRSLIRRLASERVEVERRVWGINPSGFGRAVYTLTFGGYTYSLVAFAHDLPDEKRTDRVIAEAWDTTYVLYDGVPDEYELDRLAANVPKQEAGRFTERELVLSRANKSVRLFTQVAEHLAAGRQPDAALVRATGYLMRTTAVYGNGKFGIADRDVVAGRPGLEGSFAAEMLLIWLVRGFTHDLVEHIAKCRAPQTYVQLDRTTRRHLGIGNSTGLGMAPFLVSHPLLLDRWVRARETALARVRALREPLPGTEAVAERLMRRAARHLGEWVVEDDRQMGRIETVRREWRALSGAAAGDWWVAPFPWARLLELADDCSLETQELAVALVLEPHGQVVDDLADDMVVAAPPRLDAGMACSELIRLIENNFGYALATDFSAAEETALFWYVSEEKLEPRLGRRHEEAGAACEMPLDVARRVKALHDELMGRTDNATLAALLVESPEHRDAALRVQTVAQCPYAEIRDNLIGSTCLPVDMLRFKLAFFGAAKFDPKSDRWTRITLYQGAPLWNELDDAARADDWWLPVFGNGEDAGHEGVVA